MIIPGQFGFNCPSGFREEAFWNIFHVGSNVKLSPAVVAILNFISKNWSKVLKQGLQVLFHIVMAKFPIPENCSAYVPMI